MAIIDILSLIIFLQKNTFVELSFPPKLFLNKLMYIT